MTAATNPQTVTFGTGPFTYTVPPQWRWLQIDNQTTNTVTVTIENAVPTVLDVITVAAGATFATGMGGALNNPNLNASNAESFNDGYTWQIAGSNGATTFANNPTQGQSENIGWTAQTTNQSGALANQVVVTGTSSSGNVYLSWL